MPDVLFATDSISSDHPLCMVFEGLNNEFDCQLIRFGDCKNIYDLTSLNPRIIVTNCLDVLALSKNTTIAFYCCSSNGSPFNKTDVALRRQLQVRPEVDLFCSSMTLVGMVYSNYNIKAQLQYPFVGWQESSSIPEDIIYNLPTSEIRNAMSEMPHETFKQYENIEDFRFAKIYVHFPTNDVMNTTIPIASSFGVPTVTCQVGCIQEFVNQGDTVLSPNSNSRQWMQAIKTALRDRDQNSNDVKNASRKWGSLDCMINKAKKAAQKRALAKGLGKSISISDSRREARIAEAISKRRNKICPFVPTQPAPPPPPPVFPANRYIKPAVNKMITPEWFGEVEGEIDVSIIVPLYKSSEEIKKQIQSWKFPEELSTEIIYVNDACPEYSYSTVIKTWEGTDRPIGKIILMSNRCGFATACNEGAKYAKGKYLLFLNSNVTVTSNWINPMVDLIKHDDIAIVGNLQIRSDEVISSAGMEWMWESKTFEHIGKTTYHNNWLSEPMLSNQLPSDLFLQAERDMVSSRCMMIEKELFLAVEGFDISYRMKGYEDCDLNMRIKERGFKVYYQPTSVVYHEMPKTDEHEFVQDNSKLFLETWVNNNRINRLVKAKR